MKGFFTRDVFEDAVTSIWIQILEWGPWSHCRLAFSAPFMSVNVTNPSIATSSSWAHLPPPRDAAVLYLDTDKTARRIIGPTDI
jgi:hypothetical protein